MDFQAFQEAIAKAQCSRWSPRQKRLDAYHRALHGRMYAHLKTAFSQERAGNPLTGRRVLLDERRPAVQDRLPMELVRDQAGMLFGESHRPVILAKDDNATSDWIAAFVKDVNFWLLLIELLWESSIGSGCVVLRVLGEQEVDGAGNFVPKGKGTFHFEVWPTFECRPVFARTNPSQLESLERIWFVGEDSLASSGYDVEALKAKWADAKMNAGRSGTGRTSSAMARLLGDGKQEWTLRLTLDKDNETWFEPVPRFIYERNDWKPSDWSEDIDRSMHHPLGEVPALWVRPLPIDSSLFPDGPALFDPVIDHQFRIDRTLSQVGRAFDYAGDPQMVRTMAKATGGGAFGDLDEQLAIGGTASDVIDVGNGGDAKFIEARGDALGVAIDTYVRVLRDAAREAGAMSRITPDGNARTELSGVAMEMLNFSQTVQSDILRTTVGEMAGLGLIRMAMRVWDKVSVALPSLEGAKTNPNAAATLECKWPRYYPPTGPDKLAEVQATTVAVTSGVLSQDSGIANTAPLFGVQDAKDEATKIKADQQAADDRDLDKADATAAIEAKHAPSSDSKGTV